MASEGGLSSPCFEISHLVFHSILYQSKKKNNKVLFNIQTYLNRSIEVIISEPPMHSGVPTRNRCQP